MTANPTQQTSATSSLNSWLGSNPYPTANYTPAYLQPSQLAQVTPQKAQAAQLGPVATFGGIGPGPASIYGGASSGPAATYGGASIDPAAQLSLGQIAGITSGYSPDLSPQATIQQILAGFQPFATQQQGQLNQQLAASGLSGGPALAAQNNLSSRLTQALAPTIAQAIQQSQSNQLNQGQFSSNALINALTGNVGALNQRALQQAGLTQQAGLANQSALNSGNQFNAQLLQQAGLANQAAINSGNQLTAQHQQQAGLANQAAQNAMLTLQAQLQQQANLANADAANTANTTNVGALNATQASNIAAQNAAMQAYNEALQQQWLDQFSAFNSINDAALGAQNNIAVQGAQDFSTPSTSSSYAGLGNALAGLYQPAARTTPTVPAK